MISQPGLGIDICIPTAERDEAFWYGEAWRALRGSMIRLCLEQSGDLIDLLCAEIHEAAAVEAAVMRTVERVLGAIQDCLRADPDADRWRHGMRLLAMPDRLSREICRRCGDFASGQKEHDPEALLGTLVRNYLEMARRELQTEHSPHRLRTWEQIDRISRSLVTIADDREVRRTHAHLQDVLEAIGARYPTSRNLPRNLDTLEAYFWEFAPDYQPEPFDIDRIDGRAMTADDLAFLDDVTHMRPDPLACFEELASTLAESFAVARKLQADLLPVDALAHVSAYAYYTGKKMSKRRFYRLVREATEPLVDCLRR